MLESMNVPHPGTRIRSEVIPDGMTVTDAARQIGVGRPALSNLLNGKAALTPDMATRLEKAFGFPRGDLLEMQANYDAAQANSRSAPTKTMPYTPPFLGIRSNQIEDWVDHNISARTRLPVFLRTLVHSTGRELTRVEFPGNDDGERPGWDGFVQAGEGTPWIPLGLSGWEFGVTEHPKAKADWDFEKSVKAFQNRKKERDEITFVFVTPRRWAGKSTWIAEARAKKLWKDVLAFDASDIEQWLEQSLPAQVWFSNEIKNDSQHVRSLDQCWHEWADVATPPLSEGLFSAAIEANKEAITSLLAKPPERPIRIAADSAEEALAFIAQMLSERGGDELAKYRDRVLVFDQAGILPRLAVGVSGFIAVVYSQEVERELARYTTSMHSFIVYPRNARTVEPDVILEPLSYDTFAKSLEEMGKGRDEISRLSNESGRSLTVLRRRLSLVDAIRTPHWAVNQTVTKGLVPFLFVGAWDSENETDRYALSRLAANRPYLELETELQHLVQLNDSPVWSVGTIRGVVSKIDLLYAIGRSITSDDLRHYYQIAEMVLGEDDPALDLDEDKQWAASIHGKSRKFSKAFREGISETLVLLAVHGKYLFKDRIGFDTEQETVRVVRKLLTPLTTRKLEANDSDLKIYAEAAPDEFLSIVERDLREEAPAVLGLMRPVSGGIFVHSRRVGLLWALEGLSWNPTTLPRAVFILARLSQIEIKDNLSNTPFRSLEAIFRAWMPQTAASSLERVELIKQLALKFPDIAWKLCVEQIGSRNLIGSYSHKHRWRSDGHGYGEPLNRHQILDFVREMVDMAVSWPNHSCDTLSDLVERVNNLNNEYQQKLWDTIKIWANDSASEEDKADIREKIRVTVFTRRSRNSEMGTDVETSASIAREIYDYLKPSDSLNEYRWLFKDIWVEESADEFEGYMDLDYNKRSEFIYNMRLKALNKIWIEHGLEGILKISIYGKAAWIIGQIAVKILLDKKDVHNLLCKAFIYSLSINDNSHSYRSLIAGALYAISCDNESREVIEFVVNFINNEDITKFLVLAPYRQHTWSVVDSLSESIKRSYWSEIEPQWINENNSENLLGVSCLLDAGRPRAAFYCVRLYIEMVDVDILYQILFDMTKSSNDKSGQYQLDQYSIERAFGILNNNRKYVTLDQMASLELAYVEILSRLWDNSSKSSIPNLERYIELHPEAFVQIIAWTYKRNDGGIDPDGLGVTPNNASELASRGFWLLNALRHIPGLGDIEDLEELNSERISDWVAIVRQKGSEIGRENATDHCIGRLMANAPVGSDGIWPCEAVRDVMEVLQSEAAMNGACEGVYNSRGVTSRSLDDGGSKERELAERFLKWGQMLQVSHPFVSSRLLLEVARFYDHQANCEDLDAGLRRRLG